jgi:hypothetical protein
MSTPTKTMLLNQMLLTLCNGLGRLMQTEKGKILDISS